MTVRSWLCTGATMFFSLGLAAVVRADDQPARPNLWVDLYDGEPVTYAQVLDDLATARVIYLGERHTVERHHELQVRLIDDLADKGLPLVLGLEQMEAEHQPALDRFSRKELDFDQLAEETDWAKRWRNYAQYRPALEAARAAGAPILALNARSELIRQVYRAGGVEKLPPEARKELPAKLQLNDPLYEQLLNMSMMVHAAATPEHLRPMIEAQIARDEAMAAALAGYLNSPAGSQRTAIVICGSGHVSYGLGTVERVRNHIPGLRDRILVFSASGDVTLSPEELKAARDIEITHEQLRAINRPIADYLHVTSLAPQPAATQPAQ